MMKELVAVTIPIYNEFIGDTELLSLTRCLNILSNYPIIFFAPQSLNVHHYKNLCSEKVNFRVERFDDEYFKGIAGYNKLMLSTHFYKRFLNYKFILIYQPDAFVFKDDLLYWCNQNYDFIGAPHVTYNNLAGEMQFLKSYKKLLAFLKKVFNVDHKVSNVGNGGLSLRKTRSFYLLLKVLKNKASQWRLNEDAFF